MTDHVQGESYWLAGARYTFRLTGAESGGALTIIYGEVPAGPGPPPHVHEREDETFYVLEGKLTVHRGGDVLTVGPGEAAFLPRNEKHTFTNDGGPPAKLLILAQPAGIEGFFAEGGEPATQSGGEAPELTADAIERLYQTAPRYGLILDPPPSG